MSADDPTAAQAESDSMKVGAETASTRKRIGGLNGAGWIAEVKGKPGISLPGGAAALIVETLHVELDVIREALAGCGITGIYDEFKGPADAIRQLAQHIRQQDTEAAQLRADQKTLQKAVGAWLDLMFVIGDAVRCLPSTAPDSNGHIVRRIRELAGRGG